MQIAYFWEREDAEAVLQRLGGRLRRGRFHGEDDDEDHPWVVELPAGTGADEVETVVAQYDGWLEPADQEPAPAPPPLPTGPRRLKKG
ncbi:hypothetical protein Kfla_4717 [Kribbella flavida DSM 17836]|uniref:Uncharacterized protein n=1 Tax=Kribbella flavida (strain DSM 17836 / JCM 10339 / NBRC 14399) TaxID=479435 RepID=D2PZC5_KRIFD|nr:hypothetical protein [Kribbella flavida]ADB33734.1 hypothetical protein Kfla_4717 [Kribbella flavida DSM 17836]